MLKQARIANAWKKWIGESQGVEATDGIGRKKAFETDFTKALMASPDLQQRYGYILPRFDVLYAKIDAYAQSRDYITEIMCYNVELFRMANSLKRYVNIYKNNGVEELKKQLPGLEQRLTDFYKDYNAAIDKEIALALMGIYFQSIQADHVAPYAKDQLILQEETSRY
ncbi:MAG: S46 family peptidase [Saprospiraceae bacterium]